jgi:hypothetical protein
LLQNKPRLKPGLTDAATEIYSRVVKLAAKETKFPLTYFPPTCPYSIEQLLDEDFYPEN